MKPHPTFTAFIIHHSSFIVLALLSGCRTEPFQRLPLPILNSPSPQAIREQFPHQLPDEFTSDDTLILQFPFHDDLAMLGVLNVNRPAGRFELYALNQVGFVYFHLSGDRTGVFVRDAIGPWMEHKDVLLSVARDIQHAYFNVAPNPASSVDIKPTEVVFTEKTPEGEFVYEFGMQPIVLLQKQMPGFFGPSWSARYYDYQTGEGGKLFPHDIVVDNSHFFYRLIIKNRDWSIDEKQ